MPPLTHNQKSRENGRKGELAARHWLRSQNNAPDIEILNDLIDLQVCGMYVEVKACMSLISTGYDLPKRAGRFTLDPTQHETLCQASGLYLFIVLDETLFPRLWFVRAKDLEYHNQIAWTTVLKNVKCCETLEILYKPHDTDKPDNEAQV